MLKLATEIEKLALFLEPSATASAGDVLALGEGSSEDNVYEITNALASGDAAAAIQTSRRVAALHADGEVRIVSELRRVMMLWFRIREALERGLKPQEMAAELQVAPYVLQRNLPSAQRFSISFLGELLTRLCELERSMKGGEGESRVAIELVVLDAARAAARARGPLGTGA
jgi:DNA polymerase III delta subunit